VLQDFMPQLGNPRAAVTDTSDTTNVLHGDIKF